MPQVHQVAIVLDPCFGEKLNDLSRKMHVWVCASQENRTAAEAIWAKDREHCLERGVTTINMEGRESLESLFCTILDDVDLHHGEYSHDPAWTVLHVYGVGSTPAIREALKRYHADVVKERPGHFAASRDIAE